MFPAMKSLAPCRDHRSIRVENSHSDFLFPLNSTAPRIVSVYQANLLNRDMLLMAVIWREELQGRGFSFDIDCSSHPCLSENRREHIFSKKGQRRIQLGSSKITLFWDLSSALYKSGPEPVSNFYLAVITNSQIALLLGDISVKEATKIFKTDIQIADFWLTARKQHIFSKTHFATKSQFFEGGWIHDVTVKCRGFDGLFRRPEFTVSIDNKTVIHMNKLQWKFRGNETIMMDGLLIDVMWDVHDWVFKSSGSGVFIFRSRNLHSDGSESNKKTDEEEVDEKRNGYTLVIYAHRH